jgi:hypothetical protein
MIIGQQLGPRSGARRWGIFREGRHSVLVAAGPHQQPHSGGLSRRCAAHSGAGGLYLVGTSIIMRGFFIWPVHGSLVGTGISCVYFLSEAAC